MAAVEPLTGATVYQQTDAALGGQQLGDVVTDLAPFTVPRFATTAARDTAYASYVSGGGTIVDGMSCWCDSPGSFFDRIGGVWRQRGATPTLIAHTSATSVSGTLVSGATSEATSIAIPAHTAGNLRVECRAQWTSPANAAGTFLLRTPSGTDIAGSQARYRNVGATASTPVSVALDAYYASTGAARTLYLAVAVEATSGEITIAESSFSVWLL